MATFENKNNKTTKTKSRTANPFALQVYTVFIHVDDLSRQIIILFNIHLLVSMYNCPIK